MNRKKLDVATQNAHSLEKQWRDDHRAMAAVVEECRHAIAELEKRNLLLDAQERPSVRQLLREHRSLRVLAIERIQERVEARLLSIDVHRGELRIPSVAEAARFEPLPPGGLASDLSRLQLREHALRGRRPIPPCVQLLSHEVEARPQLDGIDAQVPRT